MPNLIFADEAAMCAGLLRTLATHWRVRIDVAKIDGHATEDVTAFVQALDDAAVRLDQVESGPVAAIGQLLHESEERFRLLSEGVDVYAIFGIDVEGRVTSWNKGAQRITHFSAEEVIGRNFSMFFTPRDLAAGEPARVLARAANEGPQDFEGWRVRKDGTRFWANIAVTALRDPAGALRGFAEVTRDITHRREAELALRRAEELFRMLVEGVQDYAICLLDTDGRVTTWNRGVERIQGYTASEIVGENFARFYPPEDVAAQKPQHELQLAMDAGRYEEDGWLVRKNGGRLWGNVVIVPIKDASDRVTAFAMVIRDVTEQRAVEEFNLERAAALETANVALEAFSSSAAHELRTPARTAHNYVQMLEQSAGDKLNEQERRWLAATRSATIRMSELIEGLLTLARVTRAPVKRVPIDLAVMAREITEALAEQDPDRRAVWAIPQHSPAEGDPQLVRTLLENLIGNAWKFKRFAPEARIEFGTRVDRGRRAWFVRDNGAGFDMAHAANMFQPFERLHSAAEFEGTGVGLASVERIARRHGGDVWAESSPGNGATFWFTLDPAIETRPIAPPVAGEGSRC